MLATRRLSAIVQAIPEFRGIAPVIPTLTVPGKQVIFEMGDASITFLYRNVDNLFSFDTVQVTIKGIDKFLAQIGKFIQKQPVIAVTAVYSALVLNYILRSSQAIDNLAPFKNITEQIEQKYYQIMAEQDKNELTRMSNEFNT